MRTRGLLLILLGIFLANLMGAQTLPYCMLFEKVLNLDSCSRWLEVDSSQLKNLNILDDKKILADRYQITVKNKNYNLNFHTSPPRTPYGFMIVEPMDNENLPSMQIFNYLKHKALYVYFTKNEGEWTISKVYTINL